MNKSRVPQKRGDYDSVKNMVKLKNRAADAVHFSCREIQERREGTHVEDHRIVELYWARDEAAIAESSAKYGGYCYQIAFRILTLREDAEECVGDTWMRAWESMPPGRPSRLDTFLGKITRNLSLDRWRALRAQKRGGGQAELALAELGECLRAPDSVEQEVEASALAESLDRFLEALPQEKRVLFVRRYWYLCSVEELAVWSGRRRGSVSAALFHLRAELREHLEREGFTV